MKSFTSVLPTNSFVICSCFRDLSWNQFSGPIPLHKLADHMTTVYVNSQFDL
jgi:hypothetical protein